MPPSRKLTVNSSLQNTFSERLSPLGFNLFVMFLLDIMHEFELGVWRALLIHLLHILQAADKTLVHELDHRYVAHHLQRTFCFIVANVSPNSFVTYVRRHGTPQGRLTPFANDSLYPYQPLLFGLHISSWDNHLAQHVVKYSHVEIH